MTIKDYPELEAFVAEAIEANQYKRPEIAARNLLAAMQAVGVVPVPVEATKELLNAMLDLDVPGLGRPHGGSPSGCGPWFHHKKLYNAAIAASPYRRKE